MPMKTPASAGPSRTAISREGLSNANACGSCVARHQRRNQRLPGRLVESRGGGGQHHRHHHLPGHDVTGQGQRRKRGGHHHRHRLRRLQQPAPVPAVGEHAAERAQHQQCHRLRGADQPGLGDRAGQLVDVVQVRRDRAASADLREDDTGPVEVEIAVLQYSRNAHPGDQSTGTRASLAGSICMYTVVPGACEMCGRQRARISRLPTDTTWSTASPRNARVVTLPSHTLTASHGPFGRQHHRLRPDRHHDLRSRRHVERRRRA